jgi:N-acetylmuramoyl-L-alanine amidase
MRKIRELIWHCSATPEGIPFGAKDIDDWHKQRGWAGIGYHKVVLLDGTVEEGRPVERAGAHCRGRNTDTLGYVYIGGVDKRFKAKDTRTDAQKETMLRLTKEAIRKYGVKQVSGHNQYAAKACPSFDVRKDPLGQLV